VSLDITNLYTNIPVKEIRDIIANTLEENKIGTQTTQELLNWYDIITKQNYFTNNGKILIQQDGLAMGAPTTGIIAEFFLQNLENTHITQLSNKHKIIRYFRYVDHILIIYDPNHTDINSIHMDFNAFHLNMKFTAETEPNNSINYLNITIQKTLTNWVTSIYRKPTFTDTIIPSSNHPAQHKYTVIRDLHNRLNTYYLQKKEYNEEMNSIHVIMLNNGFPIHTHKTPTCKHPTMTSDTQTDNTTHKWVSLTYIGKETTFITNLFKKTNLKIALKTNTTIQRLLMMTQKTHEKYTIRSIQIDTPGLPQDIYR